MSKKHKGDHGDIHPDERWLITYADMITLLLAVFIVMYALSDTNLRKFNAFAQSLNAVFSNDIFAGSTQFTVSEGQASSAQSGTKSPGSGYLGSEAETMRATVQNLAIKNGLGAQVEVSVSKTGLALHFDAGLVFEPGRATVDASSEPFLAQVAQLVQTAASVVPDAQIRVEGNTDSSPVSGPFYADNWELSAARAMTVLHYLVNPGGISANRLVAVGNGANVPLPGKDPSDPANRRVEISVIFPDQSSSASPDASGEPAPATFDPFEGG
ncbi:MAG: flagellar motor protein MotB [Chloroflexota bacterium]